ncbi:MAG TPA: TIGR04283 family arsenosugar biosynthesis glycosyltransferase [Kiloniellales bacterium]|nr:TIGR04283 family arsenosugar biosynthesis glycosyltransferase [Kiloniellales bacterium]
MSVVIPALDAAETLPAVLDALAPGIADGLVREIVVADGGSRDETREIARTRGVQVLETPAGRGPQLASGARAAGGAWLLFLHADTRLGPGWCEAVRRFLAAPENRERAAVFRLRLDDPGRAARRIERLADWRARWLGLPYGDQGLLLSREFYDSLGGFRPLPLMEDVDLVRRIGRRRLVRLEAKAVTSAARYRKGGWWLRPLRNLVLLGLYFLGTSPAVLRRLYG